MLSKNAYNSEEAMRDIFSGCCSCVVFLIFLVSPKNMESQEEGLSLSVFF